MNMLAELLAVVLCADSHTLTGNVVHIADGDTLTVLDSDNHEHKIRLAGIDSPEKKQPFGSKAAEALSARVKGKDVRVEWKARDKYGRIVGDVRLGDRRINREMVECGMAWQYTRYDKSRDLREAEEGARKARRGLWADERPEPPWEFRRKERNAKR